MEQENNDVEKNEAKLIPPHYRPRSRQQSKVMPELKVPVMNMGFFRNIQPQSIALVSGGVSSILTLTCYMAPHVAAGFYAGLCAAAWPTAVIGGVSAMVAGAGKYAFEEYEKCKKNSASKSPAL